MSENRGLGSGPKVLRALGMQRYCEEGQEWQRKMGEKQVRTHCDQPSMIVSQVRRLLSVSLGEYLRRSLLGW